MKLAQHSAPDSPAPAPKNRAAWLPGTLFAALLLLLTAALVKKVYDFDIWYHLSIGREVVRSGSIPDREFLVYTLQGVPTVFHAWGYGVIVHLTQSVFGFEGLSLFNALLGALTLGVFFRVAVDRRPGSVPLALLLLLPVFLLVDFRFVYRPEMFAYLFLGLELYLLERFLALRSWKHLYLVPLLCLVLNNLHPSSLILVITLCLYAAQFAWENRRRGELARADMVKLAGAVAAALIASLLNPYGALPLLLPFKMTGSAEYVRQVVELLPTLETPMRWPALGVVAAALLALVAGRRKPLDWLLLLFFGYLGLRYVRSLPFLVLVGYPHIAWGLGQALGRLPFTAAPGWTRGSWCVAALGLAGLLAYNLFEPEWGVGVMEERFPVRAAETMTRLKPQGRIFNSEEAGGYLGWRLYPEYQVSLDGRHFERDLSLVLASQVFEAKPGWQQILAEHQVTTVFTPALSPLTGVLIDLLQHLDANEDWILLSAEPAGLLFGNRRLVPAFREFPMPDQNQTWRQVVEKGKLVPARPGRADALLSVSIGYYMLHQFELSTSYLRQYVALTPGDIEAAKALRRLEGGVRFNPEAAPPTTKLRVY